MLLPYKAIIPGKIVHTTHKEDLQNCFLSIVFEPLLITLTEKNNNSIQVMHKYSNTIFSVDSLFN